MTMRRGRKLVAGVVALAALLGASGALGQFFGGRGGRRGRPVPVPVTEDRKGIPDWPVDPRFKSDVFTFARVQYDSYGGRGRGWGGGWETDFPDSDLNFSYRLQQLTSLKVNPVPVVVRLTDEKLFDYPFLYIIEPGSLMFADAEVVALRKYLDNGGFLMVDDFWGDAAYANLRRELRRVIDQEPQELPLEHPIFHIVYPLKEKPQVPNYRAAEAGRAEGITYEYHDGDSQTVHYKAMYDKNGRMVVIICHNTDLGDGWEREGDNPWYFNEFAKKRAYPMGINIVTYAMTH